MDNQIQSALFHEQLGFILGQSKLIKHLSVSESEIKSQIQERISQWLVDVNRYFHQHSIGVPDNHRIFLEMDDELTSIHKPLRLPKFSLQTLFDMASLIDSIERDEEGEITDFAWSLVHQPAFEIEQFQQFYHTMKQYPSQTITALISAFEGDWDTYSNICNEHHKLKQDERYGYDGLNYYLDDKIKKELQNCADVFLRSGAIKGKWIDRDHFSKPAIYDMMRLLTSIPANTGLLLANIKTTQVEQGLLMAIPYSCTHGRTLSAKEAFDFIDLPDGSGVDDDPVVIDHAQNMLFRYGTSGHSRNRYDAVENLKDLLPQEHRLHTEDRYGLEKILRELLGSQWLFNKILNSKLINSDQILNEPQVLEGLLSNVSQYEQTLSAVKKCTQFLEDFLSQDQPESRLDEINNWLLKMMSNLGADHFASNYCQTSSIGSWHIEPPKTGYDLFERDRISNFLNRVDLLDAWSENLSKSDGKKSLQAIWLQVALIHMVANLDDLNSRITWKKYDYEKSDDIHGKNWFEQTANRTENYKNVASQALRRLGALDTTPLANLLGRTAELDESVFVTVMATTSVVIKLMRDTVDEKIKQFCKTSARNLFRLIKDNEASYQQVIAKNKHHRISSPDYKLLPYQWQLIADAKVFSELSQGTVIKVFDMMTFSDQSTQREIIEPLFRESYSLVPVSTPGLPIMFERLLTRKDDSFDLDYRVTRSERNSENEWVSTEYVLIDALSNCIDEWREKYSNQIQSLRDQHGADNMFDRYTQLVGTLVEEKLKSQHTLTQEKINKEDESIMAFDDAL